MNNYKSKKEYVNNVIEFIESNKSYNVKDKRVLDYKNSSLKPYWHFDAVNNEMASFVKETETNSAGRINFNIPEFVKNPNLSPNLMLQKIKGDVIWKELFKGNLFEFKKKSSGNDGVKRPNGGGTFIPVDDSEKKQYDGEKIISEEDSYLIK